MKFKGLIALLLVFATQQVGAAAFALKEQGAAYMGTAFSGTASSALDANTSFYNPAGLTELPNSQLVVSGTYIFGHVKLYNAFARNNAGAIVTNSNSTTHPSAKALIPGVGLAYRFNNRIVFGLTIGAPFGLSINYASDSITRYMGTTSKIQTVDVSPTAAYKINDNWSVGAGFDAVRVRATIASASFDTQEGYGYNEGQSWTYGYHAGLIYKPTPDVKMGLSYHSQLTPHVVGTIRVQSNGSGAALPTKLNSYITFPESIIYGVTYAYSDAWTGMAEVEWTHWSKIRDFVIQYNTGSASVENLHYKNSWRFAFGGVYTYKPSLKFRGGVSFEQTPIVNNFRTVRLPDSDRYWLALGAQYTFNKYISLDASYAHIFFKSATINQRGGGADTNKLLSGNYKSSADLVGVQLAWNFV